MLLAQLLNFEKENGIPLQFKFEIQFSLKNGVLFITKFPTTKIIQIKYLPNLKSKHYKTTSIKPNSLRFSNNMKSPPPIPLKHLMLILLIFFSKISSTCNKSCIVPIVIIKPPLSSRTLHWY